MRWLASLVVLGLLASSGARPELERRDPHARHELARAPRLAHVAAPRRVAPPAPRRLSPFVVVARAPFASPARIARDAPARPLSSVSTSLFVARTSRGPPELVASSS